MKWLKYFTIGAFVAGWFAKAVEDKKISKDEVMELVQGLLAHVGVDDIQIIK